MQTRITVDAQKCYGCRICEMVCSLKHFNIVDLKYSAIQRHTIVPNLSFRVSTCIQCPSMPCAKACPNDAIGRDESTGAVIIDKNRCNMCGVCVDACRLGNLRLIDNMLIKCDLCGGDPACVTWCPRDALKLQTYHE